MEASSWLPRRGKGNALSYSDSSISFADCRSAVPKSSAMAELDTPDLDAELAEAQAKLKSAQSTVSVRQAELDFAKSTIRGAMRRRASYRFRQRRKRNMPSRRLLRA
jgi:multidrug resistance efflux pump